jgi:hypothetical protein
MPEQLRLVVSPDGRLREAAAPAPRPPAPPPSRPAPAAPPDPELVAANRARIEQLKHLPYGQTPPPARPSPRAAVPVAPAPEGRGLFRRRRYDAFGRELHPRAPRRDPFGRANPSWPHGYR